MHCGGRLDKNIEKYVEQHFNESKDRSVRSCLVWIEKKIQIHSDSRDIIKDKIEKMLLHKNAEYWKNEKRFYANIESTEENQVKKPESILRKICYSKGKDKYTFENFFKKMPDILRFRIVCNYLSDVKEVKNIMKENSKNGNFYTLYSEKDWINMLPKKRKRGHRAIHLIFKDPDIQILFEIQIMTLLQQGWDNKEHPLLFDNIRIGKPVKNKDKIKFFAMSELLFIADDCFETLKKGHKRSLK